jgi:Response regulator containing a CheY-like receiver domain and an HTH DNA-binding domain
VRRERLLWALDSPLPLVLLETVPGGGKRTLLTQWAAEDSPECRIVVRADVAVRGPELLRLIGAEIQRHTGVASAGWDRRDGDAAADLRQQLADQREPVAVALLGADILDPDIIEALLLSVQSSDRVRLVIAAFDAERIVESAERCGLPHVLLRDQDLWFTVEELLTVMDAAGIPSSVESAVALRRETNGHPGLVTAALAAAPMAVELGAVSVADLLPEYLSSLPLAPWPVGLAKFVSRMVHVPRFTIAEAQLIGEDQKAAKQLHRMQCLCLGEMSFVPSAQQRVFRWHEPFRLGVAQFTAEVGRPDPDLGRRIQVAATQSGDHELQVSRLLLDGDLAGAEQVLKDYLWDVLPDAMQPVWEPLRGVNPDELGAYPGLLCIYQRSAAQEVRRPAALRQCAVVARQTVTGAPHDPHERLSAFARSLELARHGRDFALARSISLRARGLVAELFSGTAVPELGPGVVSNLLLIAQTSLQLGNTTFAAEFAQHALAVLQTDASGLDPLGSRALFAARLQLGSARERGLEDPFDAEPVLRGHRGYLRDADLVGITEALVWEALDNADIAKADAYCRLSEEELGARLPDWPALVFTMMIVAALRGDAAALRVLARKYEQGGVLARAAALGSAGHTHDVAGSVMGELTGHEVPSPEFIPPDLASVPKDHFGFAPRVESTALMLEALSALRAGRPSTAQACLERAITLVPPRGTAPFLAAVASAAEVGALRDLVATDPRAGRLGLGRAVALAPQDAASPASFSERELELLAAIRRGASNKAIADQLFISVNTVKYHRANLMRKLGANSRDEALEAAARLGL